MPGVFEKHQASPLGWSVEVRDGGLSASVLSQEGGSRIVLSRDRKRLAFWLKRGVANGAENGSRAEAEKQVTRLV